MLQRMHWYNILEIDGMKSEVVAMMIVMTMTMLTMRTAKMTMSMRMTLLMPLLEVIIGRTIALTATNEQVFRQF